MKIESRKPTHNHAVCMTCEKCLHVGPYPLSSIVIAGLGVMLASLCILILLALVVSEPTALLFIFGVPTFIAGGGYGMLKVLDWVRSFDIRRKEPTA